MRGQTTKKMAAAITTTGAVQVSSFSYLPQTFTTLFLLAAGLLLGLIR